MSGCCHARLPWRMAWPRHHRCRTVCNCLRTYDSCARARRGSLARLRHVHASWPGQCRACHSWASDPKMCMAACATVCSSWLAASSVSVRVEPSTLDGTTTLVRSPCRICLQACAMRGGVYHPPHNRQDARLCGWVRQHLLCTNDRRRVLLLPTGGAHFRARAERIFAGTEVPVDESDSAVQSVLRRPGQRLGKSIRAMFAISSASCVATCKIHAGHFLCGSSRGKVRCACPAVHGARDD